MNSDSRSIERLHETHRYVEISKKKSISVTIKGPQFRLFLKHLLFFSCLLYFLYFLLFVHYCLMAILEYLRAKKKVLHCGRYSFASSLFRNLFLHWIVFFLSHRKQEAFGSFFFYVFFFGELGSLSLETALFPRQPLR